MTTRLVVYRPAGEVTALMHHVAMGEWANVFQIDNTIDLVDLDGGFADLEWAQLGIGACTIELVRRARAAGWSWGQVGRALNIITRQAARQRFGPLEEHERSDACSDLTSVHEAAS